MKEIWNLFAALILVTALSACTSEEMEAHRYDEVPGKERILEEPWDRAIDEGPYTAERSPYEDIQEGLERSGHAIRRETEDLKDSVRQGSREVQDFLTGEK